MKSTATQCGYCASCNRALRRRTIRGGSQQYVWQCLDCGACVSPPVPKSSIRGVVVDFDEVLHKRGTSKYHQERAEESLQKRTEWFQQHSAYLRTDRWKAKRQAVMERAGWLCEGCRDARAVHVHHLTYDHWQDELLWELVAVCESCHEKCHKHMQEH